MSTFLQKKHNGLWYQPVARFLSDGDGGESDSPSKRNDPEYAADIDPVQLLPRLLDKLVELGDIARLISLALGDNGHRPQELRRLIEELPEK